VITCDQISTNVRLINQFCGVDEVRESCQETCDNCPFPSQAPSEIPMYSVPSPVPNMILGLPSTTKPESPVLTQFPVSTSLDSNICDDEVDATFTVEGQGEKTCQWLAARKVYQQKLCVESHLAFHICEETCGKCSDDCVDLSGTFPDLYNKGTNRNCAWLADRGDSVRRKYCEDGKPAGDICLETCDICDGQN
jgi:hypothetical protein